METKINNRSLIFLFFFLLYFLAVFCHNSWLFNFSDIPTWDEYRSIFNALGKASSGNISVIYRIILKIFALFTSDFYKLFRINFLTIHLLFPMLFFIYNYFKNVSFGFNYFLTTLIVLSPLNIVTARKLIVWELVFFLAVLIVNHFPKINSKNYLLSLFFSLLLFLRLEFILPLSISIFFVFYKGKYFIKTLLLVFFFLGIAILYQLHFRSDMHSLVIESNILFTIKNNIYLYFISSYDSFFNIFYTYKIYVLSVIALACSSVIAHAKKREVIPITLKREDIKNLLAMLSLTIPFLLVRHQDYFNIIFMFAFLFIVAHLFNIKLNTISSIFIYCISILTIFLYQPDINNVEHYYPRYVMRGQDNLKFARYLANVPRLGPKKIRVWAMRDAALLISRNDIEFLIDDLNSPDPQCPWLEKKSSNNPPDFTMFPNKIFQNPEHAKHICPGIKNYQVEQLLTDHVILKRKIFNSR